MSAPINVLAFTVDLHGDFITEKHPGMSKSTGSSLYMLPQYTVALRASRNYSKVGNLKWLKIRFCSSSSSSASLAP